MSKELIKSEKLYSNVLRQAFYDLIFDKVLDVRIFLAKICSKLIYDSEYVDKKSKFYNL